MRCGTGLQPVLRGGRISTRANWPIKNRCAHLRHDATRKYQPLPLPYGRGSDQSSRVEKPTLDVSTSCAGAPAPLGGWGTMVLL